MLYIPLSHSDGSNPGIPVEEPLPGVFIYQVRQSPLYLGIGSYMDQLFQVIQAQTRRTNTSSYPRLGDHPWNMSFFRIVNRDIQRIECYGFFCFSSLVLDILIQMSSLLIHTQLSKQSSLTSLLLNMWMSHQFKSFKMFDINWIIMHLQTLSNGILQQSHVLGLNELLLQEGLDIFIHLQI